MVCDVGSRRTLAGKLNVPFIFVFGLVGAEYKAAPDCFLVWLVVFSNLRLGFGLRNRGVVVCMSEFCGSGVGCSGRRW